MAITTNFRIPLRWGVLNATLCDKVCLWLAAGQWLSLGTPVSPTNKTDGHDIAEIFLKVVLNTITLSLFWFLVDNPHLDVGNEFLYTKNNMKTIKIPRCSARLICIIHWLPVCYQGTRQCQQINMYHTLTASLLSRYRQHQQINMYHTLTDIKWFVLFQYIHVHVFCMSIMNELSFLICISYKWRYSQSCPCGHLY